MGPRMMTTTLTAIAFLLAGLGMLVMAMLIWLSALAGLLALTGLRLPLRRRQARMMRMARKPGEGALP